MDTTQDAMEQLSLLSYETVELLVLWTKSSKSRA
jgi:hypothetical protein